MEFLKKHTRAHKYLCCLTRVEIRNILQQYVEDLHHPTNLKEYPEVDDEREESNQRVIRRARRDLQRAVMKKHPGREVIFKAVCDTFHNDPAAPSSPR
jgi:hypothetical protein